MKTLRRPKRYCFIEELQQSDIRDCRDLFEGIKDIVDGTKLEHYQALVRQAVNCKLKTASDALIAGMRAAEELSQLSVIGRCRVNLEPLQRLLYWSAHFEKDLPLQVPIFVGGNAILYGRLQQEPKLMLGRLMLRSSDAAQQNFSTSPSDLQPANDMLPDLRQDDLDARRDLFKLGNFWDCKGSSYSNYQSLVKTLVLQTILRRSQISSEISSPDNTLTFCRYVRNTLTALLLCIRGVSRTFAGSIMLKILTECDRPERGASIDEEHHHHQLDGEDDIHWRPTNNEPIQINVIHSESEDVSPAICASSGLEFTRYSTESASSAAVVNAAGDHSASSSTYLVTALYFLDPLRTIETSLGEVMTIADALEAIGDEFEFVLPQILAEEFRGAPCGGVSTAEAILQRLWPPKIACSRSTDDLVAQVLQSGYNIIIRQLSGGCC